MKNSKSETLNKKKRNLVSDVKKLIGANYTDEEISRKLDIKPTTLAKVKRYLLDSDKALLQKLDPFSYYSDYLVKITYVIRELQTLIGLAKEQGNLQTMVTAIWKKKEAYDSVIKMAQDFGIIPKASSELKLTSELTFSTMTTEEVRSEIQREVLRLKEIASRRITIRSEIAQFMDPATKAKLPDNVIILPEDKKSKFVGKGS
ncbi:MAG: hypothetical protein AB7G93_11895 [Bdellovibrionales bacterium]